jgi:adenylate cyclase
MATRPGSSVEQIRGEFAPLLLPAGRIMGDDGIYVSARQICAETGIDLELLEAMHRALGRPHVDDPDGQVHLRADAEAAARARVFVDCWLPNRRAMQSAPPTALLAVCRRPAPERRQGRSEARARTAPQD